MPNEASTAAGGFDQTRATRKSPKYVPLMLSMTERDKSDVQRWADEDGVSMAVLVRKWVAAERRRREKREAC